MRFGLPRALSFMRLRLWPESFWTLVRHRATSALCHKRTSVPDVSRCSGVDHAEHCLEMADGRYFSALLYLFNYPIPHRFAEPLGGWKRSLGVIFGITNLILTCGQEMLHILSNRVRAFPLIAQNLFQEGFNDGAHVRRRTTNWYFGHGRECALVQFRRMSDDSRFFSPRSPTQVDRRIATRWARDKAVRTNVWQPLRHGRHYRLGRSQRSAEGC
jgi:hypothetical protein